jgi:hypothetical protein
MEEAMPKKEGKRGVHTAVVLPPEMLEALRSSEGGISDEIRRRLTLTFEQDALDPVTRELQQAIAHVAATLRKDCDGPWHTSAYAYAAFNAAVTQRLKGYAPAGDVGLAVRDLFGDPETVGRLREADDRAIHQYPNLESALKRKPSRVARAIRGAGSSSKGGGEDE